MKTPDTVKREIRKNKRVKRQLRKPNYSSNSKPFTPFLTLHKPGKQPATVVNNTIRKIHVAHQLVEVRTTYDNSDL